MNTRIKLFLVITVLFLASCNTVPPNHEGVMMTNYGRNGKGDFSLVTGRHFTAFSPGTDLYKVPMFEQRGDCNALKVYASDAGEFTVDPTYAYQPQRGQGIEIAFNYKHLNVGSDSFFENIESAILNPRVLNAYREEARNFTTDSLMNNVAHYESAVQERLKKEFGSQYFDLKELSSNLTPPPSMRDAIERRNNAIQEAIQIRNELEAARMRAEKLEIEAKAQATANEIITKSINTTLIQLKFIEKWDGKANLYGMSPQYFKSIQ